MLEHRFFNKLLDAKKPWSYFRSLLKTGRGSMGVKVSYKGGAMRP
jgi:hypothetical protein